MVVLEQELAALCVQLDDPMLAVIDMELAQPYEDHAAGARAGRVTASRGIAYVAAHGIAAMFVLEHTLQHQELFPARVQVSAEVAARRVAHQAGGPCLLGTQAVEGTPVDARQRAGDPGEGGTVHDRALPKVRIQACRNHSSARPPSTTIAAPSM
ncbi:hypothetical protein FQZ97_918110 [compost metagenome]